MNTIALIRVFSGLRQHLLVASMLVALSGSIFLASFFLARNRASQVTEGPPISLPASTTLTVFTFPKYIPEEVLEEFRATTGVTVHYETFELVDEMRDRLVSSPASFDVIIADEGTARDLEHLKMIHPFDTRQLPGLEQLDPRFGNVNPASPQVLFVPYLWGSTIAAYRTDKLTLTEEEKSWKLFWDERVRNRTALISESTDIFAVGLASLGYPLHSQNQEHNQKAEWHLRRAIQENGAELGDSWANLDRLASGERWLVHCYSGDAGFCAAENDNIAYFLPREGAEIWVDGFMLSSESPRAKAAHQFVAFMLRPDVAARCASYAWYITPNRAALATVDPELTNDPVLNPPAEVLDRCSLVPALDNRQWIGMLGLGMRNLLEAANPTPSGPPSSAPAVMAASEHQ